MKSAATYLSPGQGALFSVAGDLYRILMTAGDTGGAYGLFEFLVAPGGGPPPHVHHREDELFYILEGELAIYVEGRRIAAPAGTCLNAVRDIPHYFRNETNKPARALAQVTPGGFEKMLVEAGRPVEAWDFLSVTPEDIALILEHAPKYGVDILPPSPGGTHR